MTNKPMLIVELLPCPFCGSSANIEDHRLIWAVRCTKCSACILGNRAPEPNGDGVSSDEIQDAQAAAMSESTDWAAYEKSAVYAWNSRSKPAVQHHGEPVDVCRLWNEGGTGERTSVEFIKEPCADGTLLYAGPPAIKLHLNVSNVEVTVNADGSYTIDPGRQPAPVASAVPVAWAHEDGLAGLSVAAKTTWPSYVQMCSHQSNYDGITVPLFREQPAPVAVAIPERMKTEPFTTIDRGSKNYKAGYNAAIAEVAKLNGLK